MKKVWRIGAVTATAFAMALGFTGSASAAGYVAKAVNVSSSPDFTKVHCTNVAYAKHKAAGRACFEPYGDEFWVLDMSADGYYVEMYGQVADGYRCEDHKGAAAGWTRCDGFSSKIPEGKRMVFFTGVMDKGKMVSSSTDWFATT
ncbi:hypothetical protein [Streptomyces sp. SPB074]|uniref:hypothetical protein n=1 Tax=Streptomyces sp. (strain SPB074) TaxID=465543 RepID=UPI00017F2268|nr:hypothetical protein [Streptomyces sp. SPB074]